jgi:hypothetical protein
MDKQQLQQLQENWDALLDAEGLGVIDVGSPYRGDNLKQIKGKHKRLDAMVNDPDPSGRMTNSPVTARAVETRFANADDEQSDFDDGLWDDDEDADNAWDLMILSLTGSPKEAEIADRRRAAVFGLDEKNRPRSGKLRKQRGESREAFRARVAERLGISTDEMGPLYSPWSPPKPDHAHTYAGGGPLAMVDRPKPDYGNRRDDDVRMSPVVDTDGYPSGRSPYQMSISRAGRHNSDITG